MGNFLVKSYSEFHEGVVADKFFHAESGVAEVLIWRESTGQGERAISYTNYMELGTQHKEKKEEVSIMTPSIKTSKIKIDSQLPNNKNIIISTCEQLYYIHTMDDHKELCTVLHEV